jgi:hypothetical protein
VAVPMMQIGIMGVPVHHADVPVPVGVRLASRIVQGVRVLVMFVMTMPMLVLARLVEVFVLVLFGQV